MCTIEPGALVIVNCHAPKEKLWGELRRLDAVGVVLRGLDLNSVEDWLRQERDGGEGFVSPSSTFIPMHRIERIYLDESNETAECFGDRFTAICGGDPREALRRRRRPSPHEKAGLEIDPADRSS